jgi:hypothetical protein
VNPPKPQPPPKPAGQRPPPPKPPALTQPINPPISFPELRPPPPKPTPSEGKAEHISAMVQSPDNKPDINLPAGWICAWSKSQKRWYFFDQRTNKSVWQWPPPGVHISSLDKL